jgi:two-component system, LuxR family, response regulator FixJ
MEADWRFFPMPDLGPRSASISLALLGDRSVNEEPTVFVVDDDRAMRKSLRWLLESVELRVETFDSARDFLEKYQPHRPGCVVLDVRMPGMSGLELQDYLREQVVEIPIIIITGYGDVPMAVRAMKAGAHDFIEKPVCDQVLLEHIHNAIEIDRKHRQVLAENQEIMERLRTLTNREAEVMDFVVQGLSSKEIAEKLGVSFKTIEAHRAKIMKKMGANNVSHLIHMVLLTRDSHA